jgi:hypothetical protein
VATDAPPSVLGQRGDLDRLGNQIPWNTASMPIPASYATPTDGTMPAPLSLDAVVSIAEKEGMTGEARDLFLDQFSRSTLAQQNAYGYGTVSYSLDTMVSLHMGTQLGLFTRLMMTSLCLLSIWSIFNGFVMFWKRRRPGTLGVPRRPVDVRLARRVGITAMIIAVLFPVWGVTAAAVMALDRFVIRRTRPLSTAFGQR